jgi:hypothetical protein
MRLKLLHQPFTSKDLPNLKQSTKSPANLIDLPKVSFAKKPSSLSNQEDSFNQLSRFNSLSTKPYCRASQASGEAARPGSLMQHTADKLTLEINEFVHQVNIFQEHSRVVIDAILDSIKGQIMRHYIYSPEVFL